MDSNSTNLLGTYIGRAEALESVVDAVMPLLSPEQREALANALTNLSLAPPEDTPHNWQYDPDYSRAIDGVYQALLVDLWRQ